MALHYTSCGLSNVWLLNGYRDKDTPYGPAVSIDDLDGLHRAIGLGIARQPHGLTGEEFRFLRQELDLSQARLAAYLGTSAETVARWEQGDEVPRWADCLLRALFRERTEGHAHVEELLRAPEDADVTTLPALTFEISQDGWREAA